MSRVSAQVSPKPVTQSSLLDALNREILPVLRALRDAFNAALDLDDGISWQSGKGSPEGVVTAVVGCLYTRTDGGASTTLYVKESGSGAVGWIAK